MTTYEKDLKELNIPAEEFDNIKEHLSESLT